MKGNFRQSGKIQSIQLLRGIAFILIFLSHTEVIATGPVAVSIFLVISGFFMVYTYIDRPEHVPQGGISKQLSFAWNRIKKLYPLHICTLLLVALIETVLRLRNGITVAGGGGAGGILYCKPLSVAELDSLA